MEDFAALEREYERLMFKIYEDSTEDRPPECPECGSRLDSKCRCMAQCCREEIV